MKIKLVFDNSGDELTFVPINHEVIEYYLDNLNKDNVNNFMIDSRHNDHISQRIDDLVQSTIAANEFIKKLTGNSINVYSDLEYLNQDVLNMLHAYWVNSHKFIYSIEDYRANGNTPSNVLDDKLHQLLSDDISIIELDDALDKLGLSQQYERINMNVHALERSFDTIFCSNGLHYPLPNPFPKSILTNDICNLRIAFNHVGRTLHNKYLNFDDNLEYSDENSFDQLLGFVSIHLHRPQTIGLSKEYIKWCKDRNVCPSGMYLNIGNLPDIWDKLTLYRQLVYRNLKSNNKIKLIKG
jgi:hypothetical protein